MAATPSTNFFVLGAGSWGTALALQLARTQTSVCLWSHDPAQARELQQQRENSEFLPGISFPEHLKISDSLTDIQADDQLLVVVPSFAFSETLHKLQDTAWQPKQGLAWATKGLDPASCKFLHEIAANAFGDTTPLAVLSGPTFAKEVAQGLPTALTIASAHDGFAQHWADAIGSQRFRCYTSDDITGVEIASASKNIIAIAAGVSDGLGFGANARSAIITRGLREIMRLGEAYGADPHTFMGLAGVGDLSLTCSDNQSRNRQLGLLLAEGLTRSDAEAKINQAIEGATAAPLVLQLAEQKHVDMPITREVNLLLAGNITPSQATRNLLQRSRKQE